MDSIKDIIPNVITSLSEAKSTSQEDMGKVWARASGNGGSRAVDLKEGSLIVHVDSALRMVKLNLKKDILLMEMQKHFPGIQRIYLKVAKV